MFVTRFGQLPSLARFVAYFLIVSDCIAYCLIRNHDAERCAYIFNFKHLSHWQEEFMSILFTKAAGNNSPLCFSKQKSGNNVLPYVGRRTG